MVVMEVASLMLKRVPLHGDAAVRSAELDAVKAEIDAGKKVLDSIVEPNNVASAVYFRVAAEYFKVCCLHASSCLRSP